MRGLHQPQLTTPCRRGMDHARCGFPPEHATKPGERSCVSRARRNRPPRNGCLRAAQASATMLPDLPTGKDFLQVAETILIAAIGGVAFSLIGGPAGLVSGSVLAVASAALAGRPTRVPLWLARVCFVLIGMLLGAVVTPETLAGIATWPLSVALLTVSTLC